MEPYFNFQQIPFIFKRMYFPIVLYSYTTDWILDYLEKKQFKDGRSYDNSYGFCWLNDQICSHVIDSFELTTHSCLSLSDKQNFLHCSSIFDCVFNYAV